MTPPNPKPAADPPPLPIAPMQGQLFRFATTDSHRAALSLTGNLEEAAMLKQLLAQPGTHPGINRAAKAWRPRHPLRHLSPLVRQALLSPVGPWASPFRGPGEPGLILGTAHLHTALTACAQRQSQFWNSMPAHPTLRLLHSAHTLYSLSYRTPNGLSLRAIELPPEQTHTVARILRLNNVAALKYPPSNPEDVTNIAILNIRALAHNEIQHSQQWVCEMSREGMQMKKVESKNVVKLKTTNPPATDPAPPCTPEPRSLP